MNTSAIIKFLDNHLIKNRLRSVTAVEANALLEKAKLLKDSKDRPGKPLRDLLRKGLIPHAYQIESSRSWVIPRTRPYALKDNKVVVPVHRNDDGRCFEYNGVEEYYSKTRSHRLVYKKGDGTV